MEEEDEKQEESKDNQIVQENPDNSMRESSNATPFLVSEKVNFSLGSMNTGLEKTSKKAIDLLGGKLDFGERNISLENSVLDYSIQENTQLLHVSQSNIGGLTNSRNHI